MESGGLFFNPSPRHGNMMFLGGDSIFRGSGMMLSMEENPKRRPFFSLPDDLFDEEYYDEQSPEKKRRLTPEQVHFLEKSFETENKLEPERKTQLAKNLGLQPRQVAVWFQNRRARWKTKQLERDYDVLKASYNSLLSDYETIVKDNERLKSEVVSLTGKLQANEIPVSGQQTDSAVEETPDLSVHQASAKVEEHPSTVVDEEGPQLVDSCDSYFPDDYTVCITPTGGIPSEEEEGSDDGRSYFSDVFATTEQHNEDGEPLGWWVWS